MLLVVPALDAEPWPTLGPQVCDFIEERGVYGPGSLQGLPYQIDPEFRAFLFRAFEVYPKGHPWQGRRRFKRVGLSVRKGLAKTEKMALVAYSHLHPEGPARCDGFDAYGNPVAAPVRSPYIPMLAVTVEQVEELAFGALKYIVEEGPDADLFDSSLERIVRLDERGRADGKAVPLANSPGARDGARTTLNCFDEPHRLILPRQREAHATMDANLPKRPLDDPYSLYVGTAGELGEESVAEQLHTEAEMIRDGLIERPDLFYLYRTDAGGRDLTKKPERIEAIREATGPAGEWGPGQFDEIASKWDRPGADGAYLERVWLNRWVKSGAAAFDVKRWRELRSDAPPTASGLWVAGFDGARYRDSTAIVITDVESGCQRLWDMWERPLDADEWEVPGDEVDASVARLMALPNVWRLYCDPPYWTEEVKRWGGLWPDRVAEWYTQRKTPMAWAVRRYSEAIKAGAVSWWAPDGGDSETPDLTRHLGNAGRQPVNLYDDEGKRLFILRKLHPDRKFDAAMAACLSWEARLDALASPPKQAVGLKRVTGSVRSY